MNVPKVVEIPEEGPGLIDNQIQIKVANENVGEIDEN